MRRILLVIVLFCLALSPSLMPARAQQATTYVVQPGDNLYRISLRFGVSIAAIAQANGITNQNLIFTGQTLQIPAGGTVPVPPTAVPGQPTPVSTPSGGATTYTVQPGDTLSAIAAKFGTTVAAIAQANNIVNVNLIFVGQVLSINGGTVPPTGSTPVPGGSAPPPTVLSGFELGGQVQSLSSATANVLHSAKMTWVKAQIGVGDGSAAGFIANAHNLGFKALVSVVGDKNSVLNSSYQDSYASYVAALASAGADAVEVWNEMNIDREWPTGQISPTSYTVLLKKAYTAIKAARSSTIVVSGALSPTGAEGAFGLASVWNDDRYYAGMAAAGVGNYADCIGIHYNEGIVSPLQTSGDPRDNYPTRYFSTMLNRGLASFPGKLACYTELGYLTPQGYSALPGGFSWAQNTTVAQQAQWLGQAAGRAAASGRVRLMVVFNVDFTAYGADPQAGYAIIRPGGSCTACTALAAALP